MLASILETLHALLRVTLRANGAKRVPKALSVPRPGSKEAETKPLSIGDYGKMMDDRK